MRTQNRCGSYNFQASWIDFQLRMDLGQLPMVLVDGIKVASSDANALILDVSVRLASDMEVGGRFQTLGCPMSDFHVELHQLFVATTLRMHFRPMIAQVPYFTGVVIQVRPPKTPDLELGPIIGNGWADNDFGLGVQVRLVPEYGSRLQPRLGFDVGPRLGLDLGLGMLVPDCVYTALSRCRVVDTVLRK